MIKKLMTFCAAAFSVLLLGLLAVVLTLGALLPDRYYLPSGEGASVGKGPLGTNFSGWANMLPSEIATEAGNELFMRLSLPGGAVIKPVSVQMIERDMVIPAGTPFGIKMFTEGVMVVGLSDIDMQGRAVNPAKSAGIRTGDIILSLDGKKVSFNEDVGKIIGRSGGEEIKVRLSRSGVEREVMLTPAKSPADDSYRAGMWVRDSSAGIGTMTFYDPQSKVFAGLGHAICDVDTGELMPLSSGEAVDVTITGVSRGSSGSPGELRGTFGASRVIGELFKNEITGVYGKSGVSPVQASPVPVATRSEIKPGAAVIYSTIDGKKPQAFSVNIDRIAATDANPTKNMVIRITDEKLISATGGIVQGMSGSPIIQDGKLIGAVTHVFVNDPTRGYAIFAENMINNISDKTDAMAA